MLSCLIVDDEPHASVLLKSHIEKTPFLSLVETFQSPIAALSFLQKETIDLVFLDIQMPELTGIEFLKILGGKSRVIITSAYTEYAMEGYEHDVVDYLLKPIAFDRFFRAVQKAVNIAVSSSFVPVPMAVQAERTEDFILVKTEMKGKMIKINMRDICYVEGLKNYVSIYTTSDRIIALLNIKDLEKKLPGTHFLRIHKSYIVAIDQISAIEGNQILLKDTLKRRSGIPLGVTYRETFYHTLREHIMDRK